MNRHISQGQIQWLQQQARTVHRAAWHKRAMALYEVIATAHDHLLMLAARNNLVQVNGGSTNYRATTPRGAASFRYGATAPIQGVPYLYEPFMSMRGADEYPALTHVADQLVMAEHQLYHLAVIPQMLTQLQPHLQDVQQLHLLWPELLPVLLLKVNWFTVAKSNQRLAGYALPNRVRKGLPYPAVPMTREFRALIGGATGALLTELVLGQDNVTSIYSRWLELPHSRVEDAVVEAWAGAFPTPQS